MDYSENAQKIYDKLYLHKDEIIEKCHYRVANFLAEDEEEQTWFEYLLNEQIFRVNTPCMTNAGVKRNPNLCACFPKGTLIRSKNGLIPIENIKSGDMVLTHNGYYKKVKTQISRNYDGFVYTINPSTIDEFKTTNEHPIQIIPKNEFQCIRIKNTKCNPTTNGIYSRCYAQKNEYKKNCSKLEYPFKSKMIWKNAEEIEENDHIILTFDNEKNNSPINSKIDLAEYVDHTSWKKDSDYIWFRPSSKTKRYIEIDEDFLLLMGYFAAEGTNTYENRTGFSFNSIGEEKYIEEVSRIFKLKTGITPKIVVNKKGGNTTINVCRKPIHLYIASEFGKSTCYDFNLPKWLMKLDPEYQKIFLIGFLRGDSHLTKDGHLSISLSNQMLAHQIWELFLRQGIITNMRKHIQIIKRKKYDAYYIGAQLDESHKELIKLIWPNKNVSLKKEHSSKRRGYFIDENKIAVRVKEIKAKKENIPVYNLEVENDHTYTVRNIIVHNCYILDLEDSMESIIDMWGTCARIYEGGGGAGIPITNLREKGCLISSGGEASGPLSYLQVIQSISDQVKSGGRSRRAANLISFKYDHPDAEAIIDCKADKQSFQAMNLSMLVDNSFMQSIYHIGKDEEPKHRMISPKFGPADDYIKTNELWNKVLQRAWETGDPGLLFYDRINNDNPLPSYGDIIASNPCGEIVGMPWTSCVLGHINLNKIIVDKEIDYIKFREYIYWAVLMLNRIIDKTSHPNEQFKERMQQTRPIGLGIMGLADILYKMRIPYGSEQSINIINGITKILTTKAFHSSYQLVVQGKVNSITIPQKDKPHFLSYLQKFAQDDNDVFVDSVTLRGIANPTVTCIAPTGSTSISADCSYGFEPHFALVWRKKLENGEHWDFVNPEFEKFCEHEGIKLTGDLINKIRNNKGSIKGLNDFPDWMQNVFITAHDIDWTNRIDIQAAAQQNITMSISSTVNLPNSATKEDIRKVYKYAWQQGLKGITVYRDGCLDSQPVDFGGNEKPVKQEKQEVQKERPSTRLGKTVEIKTPSGKLYITGNTWNKELREVFLSMSNQDSKTNHFLNSIGRILSRSLQHEVPLNDLLDTMRGGGGEVFFLKLNNDPSIQVSGVIDAVAHVIDKEFKDQEVKELKSDGNDVSEGLLFRCPECGQYALRKDSACRGGYCMECGYSNCL